MATVYDTITTTILAKLEQGIVPWQQPWHTPASRPRNLCSQRPYRGINLWLLASAGYASPYWLTFRQAREIGGHICKGEHGSPVVFWKWLDTPEQAAEEEEPSAKRRPVARLYTVFNVQQCELPASLQPFLHGEHVQGADTQRQIAACEQLIATMPQRPVIEHGEARAYYRPAADAINLPARALFPEAEHYYAVLFHELTHSTGHPRRLNRETLRDMVTFGDTNYSKEELIAEMGAAFLCGTAGIANETVSNSAAYIQGWLRKLRNDKTFVVLAAAHAQKAVDYILGQVSPQDDA